MSDKPIQIVIPTFNNFEFLRPCIESIAENTVENYRFNIVNNGSEELKKYIVGPKIFYTGENLGWMGGINYALKQLKDVDYDYVLLMNDDTHILPKDYDWLFKLKTILDNDETVVAVGPSSNVVAGIQNMRHVGLQATLEVKFLIGFCVLIRKKYLDEIGWLDESLPGGDDIDWSIAFRKKGYKLIARRDSFVYHHGFVTGTKVHGGSQMKNGWNSVEMTEATNHAIIKKHGFKWFVDTVRNTPTAYDLDKPEYGEDGCLAKICVGKGLDIGCGQQKVVETAIGVDMVAGGDMLGGFGGMQAISKADVRGSGDNLHMFESESMDYVTSRHNIEHYANPIKALHEWYRVLKKGGRLGISTPDDGRLAGIRLDKTHKHSFSRDCLKELVELCGFQVTELGGTENQWNFYLIAEKI